MKKIENDTKIIEEVKKSNHYKIKTSAKDILLAFEKDELKTKPKANNKKKIVFGSLGTSLILAGATAGIIFAVINNQQVAEPLKPEEVQEYFSPTSNDSLKKQLITFSGFNSLSASESMNSKIFMMNNLFKYDFEDEEGKFLEEDFNNVVDQYEKIQTAVKTVFDVDNYKILEKQVNFKYLDCTYDILNECVNEDNELLFSFYFDSNKVIKKDDDNLFFSSGLYAVEDDYFLAKFKEEKIKHDNQFSVEVIMERVTEGVVDNKLYVMKKESEYKSQKSENCYSFSIYKDKKAPIDNNEPIFTSKIEYEIKNDRFETEAFIKNEKDIYEFEDILKLNENTFIFTLSDAFINNKKIEDEVFTLKYLEDIREYSTSKYITRRS